MLYPNDLNLYDCFKWIKTRIMIYLTLSKILYKLK